MNLNFEVWFPPDVYKQVHLVKLRTGLDDYSAIVRCGLAKSLAEPNIPAVRAECEAYRNNRLQPANLKIPWKRLVAVEEVGNLIEVLVIQRLVNDGVDLSDRQLVIDTILTHTWRGTGYLVGDNQLKSIDRLFQMVV